MMENCRGCMPTVRLTEASVARLVADYRAAHPGPLATDDEYGHRVATCRACEDLLYGTTCRHCGCLAQVRARLLKQACPRPGGGRW
jgi:hypothetical protein